MLAFIRVRCKRWRALSKGLMKSEVYFKRITLDAVLRMAYKGLGWKQGDQ